MTSSDAAVCLPVTLTCEAGRHAAFFERVRDHAATCPAEESGCWRFDVLVPEDDDDTVFLYEVYADDAAVEAHLRADRMAVYMQDVGTLLTNRQRQKCAVMGPQ